MPQFEADYYDEQPAPGYGQGPKQKRRAQQQPPPPTRKDPILQHYRKFFIIPFVLLLVAVILMAATDYPNPPNEDDYDDDDEWRKDLDKFNDFIGDTQTTANLFFTIGILCLSFLFFMGAYAEPKMHIALKIVMVIIGAIIITQFLSNGFQFQTIFG